MKGGAVSRLPDVTLLMLKSRHDTAVAFRVITADR